MKVGLIIVIIVVLVLGGAAFWLYTENAKIKAELKTAKDELAAVETAKENANTKIGLLSDVFEASLKGGDPMTMVLETEKKIDKLKDNSSIKTAWDKMKKEGTNENAISFFQALLESAQTDLK